MAAPIRLAFCRTLLNNCRFPTNKCHCQKSHIYPAPSKSRPHLSRHLSVESGGSRDPGPIFIDQRVQKILKKITGYDSQKIFHERQGYSHIGSYKLLTNEELKKLQDEARQKGAELLQMPPVLKMREDKLEVISDDPEIEHSENDDCNYVFTDITYGIPNKLRTMVVREPCGRLRHAFHAERDRTLQCYFPGKARQYKVPEMFNEDRLEAVLEKHIYEYVLERACVQFEPDSSDYIRVTQRTYEHIAKEKRFEDLRSTRHFGVMTFYYVFYKSIDALLVDMLERNLLEDAGDLIRLYHIIQPNCDSIKHIAQNERDPIKLVKAYAESADPRDPGIVQLAIQARMDAQRTQFINPPGWKSDTEEVTT